MSFNAILEEGVFYTDTDLSDFKEKGFAPYTDIFLVENGESKYLSEILAPFIGVDIIVSMHYVIDPAMPNKWGYGSCQMESLDWCPCNHHSEDPKRVVNISQEGVLQVDGEHILLQKFDGERFFLPFYLLVGHSSRLAVASVFSASEMKDTVMQDEKLAEQMIHLEEMMKKLKEVVK
tara:strand:+ start:77 stop:607 length:531 start_codon:yes stop_codon:yes gene_type:complete